MRNATKIAAGTLMLASAMLAGCNSGNKASNNANHSATTNMSGGLTTGNDASAQEMVAPAPVTPTPGGTTATTNSAGSTTNGIGATPPANDGDTAPGGDAGGNSSQKEIPGM